MEILVIYAYWVSNEEPPKWVKKHRLWPLNDVRTKMVRNEPVSIANDGPLIRRYNKIVDRCNIQLRQRHINGT